MLTFEVSAKHPEIFQSFNGLLADKTVGNHVLEIGVVLNHNSLLNLPVFRYSSPRIGRNLHRSDIYPQDAEDSPDGDGNEFTVIEGDAHHMDCFDDKQLNSIVCNAVFEYDSVLLGHYG